MGTPPRKIAPPPAAAPEPTMDLIPILVSRNVLNPEQAERAPGGPPA